MSSIWYVFCGRARWLPALSPSLKTFQSECEKGPQPLNTMWGYRWCWDVGGPPPNFEFVTVGSCLGPRISLDSGWGTNLHIAQLRWRKLPLIAVMSCAFLFVFTLPVLCLLSPSAIPPGTKRRMTAWNPTSCGSGSTRPAFSLFLPQLCMQCVGAVPRPPRKGRVSLPH